MRHYAPITPLARKRAARAHARGSVIANVAMLLAAIAVTAAAFVFGWQGWLAYEAADAVRVEQLRDGAGYYSSDLDDQANDHRMRGHAAFLWSAALAVVVVSVFLGVLMRALGRVRHLEVKANALARMDGQTGMPNRRAWDERLAHELAQSRRLGYPVTVAMIDPDHFRAYNARAGRGAGDRLLSAIAAAWTASLRKGDLFARYSGERFAMLLPGCTAEQAGQLIERLRVGVPDGQTVSAGVACWHWRESPDDFIARAHEALEAAKANGRNRIELSPAVDPNVDRPAHHRVSSQDTAKQRAVETV